MASIWVNPGLNLEGKLTSSSETPESLQTAKLAESHEIPKIQGDWHLQVNPPGIVDRPPVSTQDVESSGLIVNNRGYYSPGPGTRARSADQEARTKLTQYFRAKTRRKLSKQEKRCEILWDIAIASDLVKKQLFGLGGPDSDTDEEDVDPRLRLPEDQEISFKHCIAEQVDDLKTGLSDKVVRIVESAPITDFYAEIRHLEPGEELPPKDRERRSVKFI